MALGGNNDNVASTGTVSLNYDTGVVTGSGTDFDNELTAGQVIRFGDRAGTYFGDAIILSIASGTELSIGSTAGLSGAAISGAEFNVTECPKWLIHDAKYSEASYGTEDTYAYGVGAAGTATGTAFETGVGWVGVTTYTDSSGALRVKKEILVAMSGISTGNAPAYPPA